MKAELRSVTYRLLIVSATLFALIFTGASADAAEARAEHSFTRDGLTASWTDSYEFSDLDISESPGAPDTPSTSPDAAIGNEIIAAFESSASRINGGGIQPRKPNGCSFSPDKWGKANFKPVCDKHDICYSKGSKTSRKSCDQKFLAGLLGVCSKTYEPKKHAVKYTACSSVAGGYYQAVRKLAKSYYKGSGSSA